MTRNGKIARLPREIREELNRRLDDGEQGVRLVEWLNGLPEVKRIAGHVKHWRQYHIHAIRSGFGGNGRSGPAGQFRVPR